MIPCHEYDLIEIVCMHHYPIRLTMKTGDVLEGVAIDTRKSEMREECIVVKIGEQEKLLVLDQLFKLQVCIENPHISEVTFGT